MKTKAIIKISTLIAASLFSIHVTLLAQDNPDTDQHPQLKIERIDSLVFYSTKLSTPRMPAPPRAVTDFREAKDMLWDRITWGHTDEDRGRIESDVSEMLLRINFDNENKYCSPNDEEYFIAYYPLEDILLLEGGHTTDVSYNLTTGETTVDVGNPGSIVFSPSGEFRLNGHFGGQECSNYFIQKRKADRYSKIIQLDSVFEDITGIWLCTLSDAFWTDDQTLYFKTSRPDENAQPEYLYYRIVLPNDYTVQDNDTTQGTDLVCRAFNIEMGQRERCIYNNCTLEEAYRLAIEKLSYKVSLLKDTLPQSDMSYNVDHGDSHVEIRYTYKNSNKYLHIEIWFEMGSTTIWFWEEGTQTLVTTVHLVD